MRYSYRGFEIRTRELGGLSDYKIYVSLPGKGRVYLGSLPELEGALQAIDNSWAFPDKIVEEIRGLTGGELPLEDWYEKYSQHFYGDKALREDLLMKYMSDQMSGVDKGLRGLDEI
jgi:hypothetical protein